jgi:hypothetical protein
MTSGSWFMRWRPVDQPVRRKITLRRPDRLAAGVALGATGSPTDDYATLEGLPDASRLLSELRPRVDGLVRNRNAG